MTEGIVTGEYTPLILIGNTLYVGGDGLGNYTKIQDAIDNAMDGDTVYVYDESSPYSENIVISKSITLIGENRNSVIINGCGAGIVVYCNASNVSICGFTIQNSGNNTWPNAGIFIKDTHNNIITGNIIIDNCMGIYCYNEYDFSSNHIISENIITNNTDTGIDLSSSYKNEVYENYIEDNKFIGIRVGTSTFPSKNIDDLKNEFYNNIYRNTITKNNYGIFFDIVIYNNIYKNNVTNNNYGIHLAPPYLGVCSCNAIYQNNINNNTYGIFAGVWDSGSITANTISKNNIMYNKEGINFVVYDNGVFNCNIERNKILHNNFIGNTKTVYYVYSFFNRWIGNYWGKARILPYPLIGKLRIGDHIYRWIAFDWRPAKEPYDIS